MVPVFVCCMSSFSNLLSMILFMFIGGIEQMNDHPVLVIQTGGTIDKEYVSSIAVRFAMFSDFTR
jgi:hypothetical protein